MKFPDLVHAVKPEPHHAIPQAASAHDTFWDFVSLMPESTHMLMWVMSDRAIPRSFRMMQGFGVHTFRLVNEQGESTLRQVPLDAQARHALAGLGRGGQDRRRGPRLPSPRPVGSDRGRRVSRSGSSAFQLFTEEQAEGFSFDVLDATKLDPGGTGAADAGGAHGAQPQPGQLLCRNRAGRVLRRARRAGHRLQQRPAARRAHPLLRGHAVIAPGRTQFPRDPDQLRRSRRCTTTSATACIARRSIAAASPTSPTRSAAAARSRPAHAASSRSRSRSHDDKVRGKPEKFADHYTQARLFFNSQSPAEKAHIIGGFRFELSKLDGAGDPRTHAVVAGQRARTSWPRACRRGAGHGSSARDAACAGDRGHARGRRSRRRCR